MTETLDPQQLAQQCSRWTHESLIVCGEVAVGACKPRWSGP
ncbi:MULTISPECIES: hypothetical protein [unclassified Rhodococcus (in: high G+C Gram-positive bacteria)]|nr:hypothetical protein [Rhodococcus sp. M8]